MFFLVCFKMSVLVSELNFWSDLISALSIYLYWWVFLKSCRLCGLCGIWVKLTDGFSCVYSLIKKTIWVCVDESACLAHPRTTLLQAKMFNLCWTKRCLKVLIENKYLCMLLFICMDSLCVVLIVCLFVCMDDVSLSLASATQINIEILCCLLVFVLFTALLCFYRWHRGVV